MFGPKEEQSRVIDLELMHSFSYYSWKLEIRLTFDLNLQKRWFSYQLDDFQD